MKRLALLAVTAFVAVLLSACGNQGEKKAENNAATAVEQSQPVQDTTTTQDATTDSTATPATEVNKPAPVDQSGQ